MDLAKGYLYALYGEAGTAKSKPVLYGITADATDPGLEATAAYTVNADGDNDYFVTLGWTAIPGVTYKLERAASTTYPNPSLGAFTDIPLTGITAIAGRYAVVDTPTIRSSYVYRLSGTGIPTVTKTLADYPFSDSVDAELSVDESTTVAYATEVSITIEDTQNQPLYDNDLVVDIYRADGTSASESAYDTGAGKLNFKLLEAAFSLKDETPSTQPVYTDTGLVIGTKYVYRIVVKVKGGKELYNENADLQDNAGYVQTPSKPSISNFSSAITSSASSGNTYYYKFSSPPTLSGIQVQLQSKASTPANSSWVKVADSTVDKAGSTPPSGSSLVSGDSYFIVTKPSNVANTSYRIVLVDDEGNTASTADNASAYTINW